MTADVTIIPLAVPTGPRRGETCRVTIETKETTYVWEGRFFDAEWKTDHVEVDHGGITDFIPTSQHLRLHLIKDR